MAAEFRLGGYEPGELKEIFDLLRGLRLANGDFIPREPGLWPALALQPSGRTPGLPAVDR